MPTMEEATKAFLVLRKTKEEIAKRHKEELAPYNEKLDTLKAFFLKYLQEQKLKNFASDAATVSTSRRGHAKVVDFEAFSNYIIENEAWHLMDKKANAAAVREFIEEIGDQPPGISFSDEITITVRAK